MPVAATRAHTIYGTGPLIYCVACNENYSNEPSFIRHSFLSHLMDPNVNLNWYKVYTPVSTTATTATKAGVKEASVESSSESTLQQIAAAMAMADLRASGDLSDGASISLVDASGQPIMQTLDSAAQLTLLYECPLCFRPLDSKEGASRHLLYHAINERHEYDVQCVTCAKHLAPAANLAECLLHTREFRAHRLAVNFHKYVLATTQTGESQSQVPMVACVLCGHESTTLIGCTQHIMSDHFAYDTDTIRMKRFVNFMVGKSQGSGANASTTPASNATSLGKVVAKALTGAAALKQKQLQLQQHLNAQHQQPPPQSKQVRHFFFREPCL